MSYNQRAYERKSAKTAGAAVFGGCLTLLALPFINAWWLMLLIGAAHHEISDGIPAVGYWGTFIGVLIVSAIGQLARGAQTKGE